MTVTNEELARAAEAGLVKMNAETNWVEVNAHTQAELLVYLAGAASVLRPSGSILLGGTCAGCRWSEEWIDRMFSAGAVEMLMCANTLSPCGAKVVRPDFTCALWSPRPKAAP